MTCTGNFLVRTKKRSYNTVCPYNIPGTVVQKILVPGAAPLTKNFFGKMLVPGAAGLQLWNLLFFGSFPFRESTQPVDTLADSLIRLLTNSLFGTGRSGMSSTRQRTTWYRIVALTLYLAIFAVSCKYVIHWRTVRFEEGRRFVPPIPPIPCRDDFAAVAEQFFKVKGRAAEIGVFQGKFAAKNVKHWRGEYYMIDAWQYRKSDVDMGEHGQDKNFASEEINIKNMNEARERVLSVVGVNQTRVHLVRDLSVSAASRFPDEYFDWLYVDAMHDFENVVRDLEAWWPKLRQGGLFSGDDYGDFVGSPLMSAERFSKVFGSVAIKWKWGVQRAVLDFCARNNLVAQVTWAHDCYQFPAWYVVKPHLYTFQM